MAYNNPPNQNKPSRATLPAERAGENMAYYYPAFISYRSKTYTIEKDGDGKDKYASVQKQNGEYRKTKVSCETLRSRGTKLN